MSFRPRIGGGLETAKQIRAYAAGTLRNAKSGRVMVDNDLETFFTAANPMAVSIFPEALIGSGPGDTIGAGTATAIVSGGTGPFTYSWVETSPGYASVSTSPPNVASISFTGSGLIAFEPSTSIFTVTVTDALGNQDSASIPVTFIRE